MGCRLRLVALVVAAVLAVAALRAPLGAAEPAPVEPAPGRLTVGEPTAEAAAVESHDRLKASVRPLTEQELADLATVWRDRLKDKVREISDLRTGAAAGADAAAPGSALSRLQEERTILTDRLRVVLDEWERKGGDPKEFRLYASAVNGLEMDVTNAGTALVVLKNWLLSPQGGIRWLGNIIRFLVILFASWMLS